MNEEHHNYRRPRQVNLNSLISSAVGIMVLLIGWGGKVLFERTQVDIKEARGSIEEVGKKLSLNNDAVVELKVTVTSLKDSVKECVLRSEFSSEMSRVKHDMEILRQETDQIRRQRSIPKSP